jgi:hypothetical protein
MLRDILVVEPERFLFVHECEDKKNEKKSFYVRKWSNEVQAAVMIIARVA